MYRFDRVLTGPSPDALDQALSEAGVAANHGCRARLLIWPPNDFPAFITAWRAAAEGEHQWTGPGAYRKRGPGGDTRSAAAVAWWSDPLGRKHCRVVADRVECGGLAEQSLFQPDSDRFRAGRDRPALWRVYPDDLYLRQQGSEWQLWAACRCGAAGPPAELGWMGPWCAACHDRAEEGDGPARPGACRPVVFAGHPFWVGKVAFCAGGRTLLVQVLHQPAVWAWDTASGRVQRRKIPSQARHALASALTVSADGRSAALCVGGQVHSWSLLDGTDGQTLPTHLMDNGRAVEMAFSPDGTVLATAGEGHPDREMRLTLHDRGSGEVLRTLGLGAGGSHWGVSCLSFSPDGRTLALGWGRPMVRLWNVATGAELPAPLGDGDPVVALAYSPDGETLAAARDQWSPDSLRLWDVTSGAVRASLEGPVAGLAFSPNRRQLATVGDDGCLRLRDGRDGRLLAAFRWHQSAIDTVAFSPDGDWLATGGKEDRVKLWPVDQLLAQPGAAATPRGSRKQSRR